MATTAVMVFILACSLSQAGAAGPQVEGCSSEVCGSEVYPLDVLSAMQVKLGLHTRGKPAAMSDGVREDVHAAIQNANLEEMSETQFDAKLRDAIEDGGTFLSSGGDGGFVLFNKNGDAGGKSKKQTAVAMIDSRMEHQDFEFLQQLQDCGAPALYSVWLDNSKHLVQQWVPSAIAMTATGGKLANQAVLELGDDVLTTMREDVKHLCAAGYNSNDMQFIADSATGHLYPVDFEEGLRPSLGGNIGFGFHPLKVLMADLNKKLSGTAVECKRNQEICKKKDAHTGTTHGIVEEDSDENESDDE